MTQIVGSFVQGFFLPLKGLAVIFGAPKKVFLSLLPFLIGFLTLGGGVLWAFANLGPLVHGFLQNYLTSTGTWFAVLSPILGFLAWAGFLTLGFLLLYVLVSVLAGPFLSLLAEEIHSSEGVLVDKNGSLSLMVRMFLLSLGKALFFLVIAGLSFILWFFPPLNFVGSFLVLLTIAFDCMDYSFEVALFGFKERFAFFFRHIWLFSGLASAVLLTTLLPGVFFLLLPGFVAGASKKFVELQHQKW